MAPRDPSNRSHRDLLRRWRPVVVERDSGLPSFVFFSPLFLPSLRPTDCLSVSFSADARGLDIPCCVFGCKSGGVPRPVEVVPQQVVEAIGKLVVVSVEEEKITQKMHQGFCWLVEQAIKRMENSMGELPLSLSLPFPPLPSPLLSTVSPLCFTPYSELNSFRFFPSFSSTLPTTTSSLQLPRTRLSHQIVKSTLPSPSRHLPPSLVRRSSNLLLLHHLVSSRGAIPQPKSLRTRLSRENPATPSFPARRRRQGTLEGGQLDLVGRLVERHDG